MQTFDGSHYDFMGVCQYVMMKEDITPGISVVISATSCDSFAHGTCEKEITVRLNGTVISLRSFTKVSVQGLDTVLPFIGKEVKVRQVRE